MIKCSCQCPRGSDQGSAYTTVYSAKACIDACTAVPMNSCVRSNTYACLESNCVYSTDYSLTDNSPSVNLYTLINSNRMKDISKMGNKRTRRDVISYSNGDRYDGRVKDGKKHGIGTYNWASGDKYTGNWIDGNRTGYASYTWSHGDRYKGKFKDGLMHGIVTFNFANGN